MNREPYGFEIMHEESNISFEEGVTSWVKKQLRNNRRTPEQLALYQEMLLDSVHATGSAKKNLSRWRQLNDNFKIKNRR